MKENETGPPRWALQFFRWYCHPDFAEDIEGDLIERFERKVEEGGLKPARWQFTKDVIRLFRPGIIKSLGGSYQLNQYGMFKNYFKVGIRNVLRHKAFSFINITGLGVGIACCILIMLYVKDELSYDKYHENYDNIYRVLHTYRHAENPGTLPPPTPQEFQVWGGAPVGPALKADFAEIESYFRFTSPVSLLFQYEDKRFQENNMVFGDSTAFSVFSWKLLSGDSKTALKEPNSIVLTEKIAKKYFGDEEALGKTFIIDKTESFVVTGVMEDVPSNSHFTFDGLVSMTTFHSWRSEIFDMWGYVDFYTYFTLNKHANIATLENQIPDFLNKYIPEPEWKDNTIAFEPLADAYLRSEAARQPGATGSLTNLYIFSSIAAFILLIACINFMNLSTARSMERAKEIGVRKSIGAQRGALVTQFLLESVLLSVLASMLALALVLLLMPVVQDLSAKQLDLSDLFSSKWIGTFAAGVIFIGLFAGAYPALILARFKSVQVLKGTSKASVKGLTLRKALVVFQFTLSIALIVGTAVVFSQLEYLRNHDLGFKKEQMLVIDFGWDGEVQNAIESIKSEYLNHPDVVSVSASRAVPGNFYPNAGTRVESPDGEMIMEGPGIYEIDPDFIPAYQMEMAAGRTFSSEFPADSTQSLLLNEAAIRLYGYSNPEDIIGKKFSQWGREGTVIGVVKNFNFKSLHNKVEPLSLRFAHPNTLCNISLRIESDNMAQTVAELKERWEEVAPQRPFLYSFLDENFNRQYQSDIRFGKIFTAFAVIAIFIACLGLFGLTTYTTGQRTKEIGIRKVLGASVTSIVALLSKDYVKLFFIAVLFATPVSWFVMNRWLDGFAYKVEIGVGVFIMAASICVLIALTTISWQSIAAALRNPVESLKDE